MEGLCSQGAVNTDILAKFDRTIARGAIWCEDYTRDQCNMVLDRGPDPPREGGKRGGVGTHPIVTYKMSTFNH